MLCSTVKLENIFKDCHNRSQDRHDIQPTPCPLQNGYGVKDFKKRSVEESHKLFQILNIKFDRIFHVYCVSDVLLNIIISSFDVSLFQKNIPCLIELVVA